MLTTDAGEAREDNSGSTPNRATGLENAENEAVATRVEGRRAIY